MADRGLNDYSVAALLGLFSNVLAELRDRGIVRSTNNPIADYTEWLVARALGLTLETASAAGYDAMDADRGRYQVKGRRLTPESTSRQLSIIRGLRPDVDMQPFDFLAAVLFEFDFRVKRGALIPVATVLSQAKWTPHVSGWRFLLRDSVWDDATVQDITDSLRVAAESA